MQHKWQSYDVWFLRYEGWQTEFFVILDCFLPFYLPKNPKNQNLEKLRKTTGDIIILHMCTINDNQMIMVPAILSLTQIFLLFWTIFYPFTSLTTQNIKILKKIKKHLEISSFYTSVPKIMITCYTVTEIWCVTHVIIFHFGPLFTLLPPNSPKNEDF